MLKRLFKILLKVLLLLVVLLFAFLLFERWRGEISLAAYKRELAAKGETLDIHKLLGPPVADADNGAPLFFAAARQLKEGSVLPAYGPPKMKMASASHAVVGFREAAWVDFKTNYNWKQLSVDLQTNEAALAQVRTALEKPAFDNQLDYSLGFKMPITNLIPVKQLANWFGGASELALHEGNTHEAAENLTAQIRLPLLLGNDHIIIGELVRDALATMAKFTTWEALQANGWTDGDLEKIQHAWQEQGFITNTALTIEDERIIYGNNSYTLLRKSNEETINTLYWMDAYSGTDNYSTYAKIIEDIWKKQVYCRIWRFTWSHQNERHYLEAMQTLIELARSGAQERSYSEIRTALERFDVMDSNYNFYDNWRFPLSPESYLWKTIPKALHAETDRSMVLCAIALKRYSLRHGNYPASLDALVPEFLPSVPVDYMDGKPMKYHLNADGSFTLYSVGEDGKDDGGDASLPPGSTYYQDLWRSKDMVWPQPATPAEVEAWRKAEAKN